MSAALTRYRCAADLPSAWDDLATSVFQTRALLAHAEANNPCRQRYWVFSPCGRPTAGAVVYSIALDLLTYRGIPSPLSMQVIGLPFSVGWPGLLGEPADLPWLVRALRAEESGFLVGLNTVAPLAIDGLPQGATLPTVVLERSFSSLKEYRGALRSAYRRRFDRLRAAFAGVQEERLPASAFTPEMYVLYRQAFERSDAKLELLPERFFTNLPGCFRLTVFRTGGRLLAWHVTAFEEAAANGRIPSRATFFMGGVAQDLNEAYSAYHNLLFSVLEQAFERRAAIVELGQTAEVAKTRAGGTLVPRGLFAYPRRGSIRALFRTASSLFTYQSKAPPVRVFGA